MNDEYLKFTKKRLNNKWTKDTTEIVILTSCGDEFFRNKKKTRKIIEESNSRNQNYDYPFSSYSFWKTDYNTTEPFLEINKYTDSLQSKSCIIYKLCTEKTVPLLMKRINFQYFHSSTKDTDYHIMSHNSQIELKTITYFWLMGFWIKMKTDNQNPLHYGID